jgi:hypothetical protein
VPDVDIWFFANTGKRFTSVDHPIVQSYVDVCLNGCLEIEAMYPPAKKASFAEHFIRTTDKLGAAMDQRPYLSLAALCTRSAGRGD